MPRVLSPHNLQMTTLCTPTSVSQHFNEPLQSHALSCTITQSAILIYHVCPTVCPSRCGTKEGSVQPV